jgi:hypothetical protein
MDPSTRVMRQSRRPGRAWPPPARTAVAIMATAGLALLAAACSSSPASTGPGGSSGTAGATGSPSAVAYSQCIRSHGVPNFPDPASNGQVPKASPQQLGVSSSQLQAAQTACEHLYPASGGSGGVLTKDTISQCEETGNCPQGLVQQAMTALRAYARCMRSHGVPNWPDPTIDSEGRPGVNLVAVPGNTDWNGARISNIMQECQYVMPNNVPVPVIAPGTAG